MQYKADALKVDMDNFSARCTQAAMAARFDFVSFITLEASKLGLHVNPVATPTPKATKQTKPVPPAHHHSPVDEVMKDTPSSPPPPPLLIMVRPLITDPAVEVTHGLATSAHAPAPSGIASSMHAPKTPSPTPTVTPPMTDTDRILAAIGHINKKVDTFNECLAWVEQGERTP